MKLKKIFIVLVTLIVGNAISFSLFACEIKTDNSGEDGLEEYKENKMDELQEYVDELLLEYKYDAQSGLYIDETVTDGKKRIKDAADVSAVDKVLSETQKKIQRVQPILDYNATTLLSCINEIGNGDGKIKDAYLAQNRTIGVHYLNEDYDPSNPRSKQVLEDTTSPEWRANIITERTQLEEVFPDEIPKVDFENEMVLTVFFTVNYKRVDSYGYHIQKLEQEGETLKIHVQLTRADIQNENKPGYNNWSPPPIWQAVQILKMDKTNVTRVEIYLIYK
ncbi:MAG: hypothetical protein J5781_06950 [Clostridia bacterium]|nr:hypothetical protein [Clostridia bacterium]